MRIEILEHNPDIKFIRWHMSRAAMYEQLAEEASELTKAALKMARVLRGENPTPVTLSEADRMMTEEFSDLLVAATALDLKENGELMEEKAKRWAERVMELRLMQGMQGMQGEGCE